MSRLRCKRGDRFLRGSGALQLYEKAETLFDLLLYNKALYAFRKWLVSRRMNY